MAYQNAVKSVCKALTVKFRRFNFIGNLIFDYFLCPSN